MSAKKQTNVCGRKQRILLVDDHAIVREGFAEVINQHGDFHACCQASTAAMAMDLVVRMKPDLVIVDLSLEGGSGLDLIKNLKALHPKLRMLVLSMHDEGIYAERALRAGALGYVMKSEHSGTLLAAIRTVLRDEVFVSEATQGRMLHRVVGHVAPADPSMATRLSDRELEVFKMLGEGRTTRQIAQHLHLSVSTVETHRAHLKEKLLLRNGAELIRAAVQWANAQ